VKYLTISFGGPDPLVEPIAVPKCSSWILRALLLREGLKERAEKGGK